ncbi:hypothetical protein [Sphaerisporangium sp. TRM90804]|uniref:hypothetical protein n=1 Tax=Sphaerisporangium sp. TRM90804 TaxID=3031113 RepID=UPI002449CA76|nr:hypothetical protein [Sphaerisporangium sp. TRM90804]MDH2428383.1 hypothetical protein [Sphaerisporangium sp. TRM90804]
MTFQHYAAESPIRETSEPPAPVAEQPVDQGPHQEDDDDKAGVLDLLEKAGAVVVPLGVTLYALLYMGYQGMYAVFGITPEQAGIDQSVLLGRLLGTILPLLILGAVVVGLLLSAGWLLNVVTRGRLGRLAQGIRRQPWIVAAIAAAWAGASYLGWMYFVTALDAADPTARVTVEAGDVLLAAGLGVLAYVVPFRLLRRRSIGRAGLKIMVGALTGIGLGYVLMIQMIYGAISVLEKGESTALMDAVGFQTQWAKLQDSGGKPLYDSRWMMVLGEHEGGYAIYDCDKGQTFRKFSESTILSEVQMWSPDREKGFTCGTLTE